MLYHFQPIRPLMITLIRVCRPRRRSRATYQRYLHKRTRPGSIHDGLRATSSTFLRPASARGAHAGLFQRPTESHDHISTKPTTTHATSTTGVHHPALSRTLIPGAATTSGKPHRPQLSAVLRRSTKYASTVQYHGRASGGHGHSGRVRAAELRIPDAPDHNRWITTDGGYRCQKRTYTTVTTASAKPHGTPAFAGLAKPQDVPRSPGTLCEQPPRPERADGDDGPPTSSKLCPSPDAATSSTSAASCGFSS